MQEAGHHCISASWALVTRVQVGRGNHHSSRNIKEATVEIEALGPAEKSEQMQKMGSSTRRLPKKWLMAIPLCDKRPE